MAELADALDLGSSVSDVQVQVLLSAYNENSRKIKRFLVKSIFCGCFFVCVYFIN